MGNANVKGLTGRQTADRQSKRQNYPDSKDHGANMGAHLGPVGPV